MTHSTSYPSIQSFLARLYSAELSYTEPKEDNCILLHYWESNILQCMKFLDILNHMCSHIVVGISSACLLMFSHFVFNSINRLKGDSC